jgi:hypothetical protein
MRVLIIRCNFVEVRSFLHHEAREGREVWKKALLFSSLAFVNFAPFVVLSLFRPK